MRKHLHKPCLFHRPCSLHTEERKSHREAENKVLAVSIQTEDSRQKISSFGHNEASGHLADQQPIRARASDDCRAGVSPTLHLFLSSLVLLYALCSLLGVVSLEKKQQGGVEYQHSILSGC